MQGSRVVIDFISNIRDAVSGIDTVRSKISALESAHVDASGRMGQENGRFASSWKTIGADMANVGKTMTAAVTLPIVAGLGMATKSAIEFDKVMNNVSRAANLEGGIDGMSKEVASFRGEILKLAPTVGLLPTAFAEIAAESAKLGVSKDRLMSFSKTVGEVAQIGDLTGQEVTELAKSFAGFQTITGATDAQIKDLAATMNRVDDEIGGSLPAITKFISKTAATGAVAGVSTNYLAALAGTMLSVGVETNVAYRSTNALMNKLSSVNTLSSTAQDGLESLGFTTSEMSDMMRNDAEGGIRTFLQRIKDVSEVDYQRALGAVQQLIGADYGDEMITMAKSLDKFDQALKIAGDSVGNMNKYQSELAKKSQSVSGQMAIAQGYLQSIGISIGYAILPALINIMGALTPVISGFADFAAAHPKIVTVGVAFLAVAAVLPPLIWLVGSLMASFGAIGSAVGVVIGWFGAFGGAVASAQGLLNGFIFIAGGLAAPFVLGASALAIWGYNLYAYISNWEDALLGIWVTLQEIWGNIMSFCQSEGSRAGWALVSTFAAGILGGIPAAIAAAGQLTSAVRKFLPFSPAKEGALSDLDKSGVAFVKTISTGIDQSVPMLTNAVGNLTKAGGDILDKGVSREGSGISPGVSVDSPQGTTSQFPQSQSPQSSPQTNITINLTVGNTTQGSPGLSLLEQLKPVARQVGEEIEKALNRNRRGQFA